MQIEIPSNIRFLQPAGEIRHQHPEGDVILEVTEVRRPDEGHSTFRWTSKVMHCHNCGDFVSFQSEDAFSSVFEAMEDFLTHLHEHHIPEHGGGELVEIGEDIEEEDTE